MKELISRLKDSEEMKLGSRVRAFGGVSLVLTVEIADRRLENRSGMLLLDYMPRVIVRSISIEVSKVGKLLISLVTGGLFHHTSHRHIFQGELR